MRSIQTVSMIVILCLLVGRQAACQETAGTMAVLRVEPQRQSIGVVDPLVVQIIVDGPQQMEVTLPPFGKRWDKWEVIDVKPQPSVPLSGQSDRWRWQTTVILESIRAGTIELPPLEVLCQFNGRQEILTSQPIAIDVSSLLTDDEDQGQPGELKGTIEVATSNTDKSPWLVPLLGVLVLAGIAILVWLHRSRRTPSLVDWVDCELNQIASEFGDRVDAELYGRLSSLLRQYLQQRLAVMATSQTDEELVASIRDRHLLSESTLGRWKTFFHHAGQAQYAGVQGQETTEGLIQQVRELIDQTESADATRKRVA